jgi:hypothetical protein
MKRPVPHSGSEFAFTPCHLTCKFGGKLAFRRGVKKKHDLFTQPSHVPYLRLASTGIGIILTFLFPYTGLLPVYAEIGEICGIFSDFVYRKNGIFCPQAVAKFWKI